MKDQLEKMLGNLYDKDKISDAVLAQNDAQRHAKTQRRAWRDPTRGQRAPSGALHERVLVPLQVGVEGVGGGSGQADAE